MKRYTTEADKAGYLLPNGARAWTVNGLEVCATDCASLLLPETWAGALEFERKTGRYFRRSNQLRGCYGR